MAEQLFWQQDHAAKCTESMRSSGVCPLCVAQCHFDAPFKSIICSSRIKAPEWLWLCFGSDLMPLHLFFLAGCQELPGGGIPRGQSVWLWDVEVKAPRLRTVPWCCHGMGVTQHSPSFPLPGLSWMISTPAPRVPSSQSSGLPQRFSPTATTAPNLTFGHSVRNSGQNGENSTAPAEKNRGLRAQVNCPQCCILQTPRVFCLNNDLEKASLNHLSKRKERKANYLDFSQHSKYCQFNES